jgi:hypothetical protein
LGHLGSRAITGKMILDQSRAIFEGGFFMFSGAKEGKTFLKTL